jgi:hypothetical protein
MRNPHQKRYPAPAARPPTQPWNVVDATLNAGPRFQRWLREEVRPHLLERRFRQRGLTFERGQPAGNICYLEFVRDKWSTAEIYVFSLYVAVFSPRLAEHQRRSGDAVRPPSVPRNAHFARSVGELMNARRELYWRVPRDMLGVESEVLGESIRDVIDRVAMPWLDARATDEGVRDALLAEVSELDSGRLQYLHWLVADLGPLGRLAEIAEFRRTEPERRARETAAAFALAARLEAGLDEDSARAADAATRRTSAHSS